MANTTNYKQQATADVLASELASALGVTVTWAFVDAQNTGANAASDVSPVLTVGTVTTTNGGVTVVVANQRGGPDTGAAWQDIIGNSQPVYTGTVYQIIYEAHLTSIAVGIMQRVGAILAKRGGRVEFWKVNSGQSANLSGAGLALVVAQDNNIWYKLEDRA